MSDIRCAVCGEPWDQYHLRHDAPAWVRPLFYAGAGCESCEGVPPDRERDDRDATGILAHVADRILTPDDDDVSAGIDIGLSPRMRPQWKRPDDARVWECSCCVKVMRDHDYNEGKAGAYYVDVMGHERARLHYAWQVEKELGVYRYNGFESREDAVNEISHDGESCKLCLVLCRDCGSLVDTQTSYPDPADEMAECHLCEDCYSTAEHECAIESWSAWDLAHWLAVAPAVKAWLRDNATAENTHDLDLWEVAGASIDYRTASRRGQVDRNALAGALWELRRRVRVEHP